MRPACSLLLALLLTGCSAATSRTNEDPDITTRVKIALLGDAELGARRLDVRTFQGVVTLSGTVRSDAEAAQAVAIARRIGGVRGVKPALRIQGAGGGSPVLRPDVLARDAERQERLRQVGHH